MVKVIAGLKEEGIFEIKLNRPEVHHAIDFEVMDQLEKAISRIQAMKDLRAVIVTGSGDRTFCSGGDLSAFHSITTQPEAYEMLSRMGKILYELNMLSLPTFAVLNGTAVGGGCEIAAACDIRIGKEGAFAGFIQGQLGITTGWGGGTLLFEKLPHHRAIEFLLSSKKYTTLEAKNAGFFSEILPEKDFQGEAQRYIHNLLNTSSIVAGAYKRIATERWSNSDLWSRMEQEILSCSRLWESKEHTDAVEKFSRRK
ncbi:enoyl-CoA hydratase/isomerase family protein [Metabacillus lacus]|nr:enoyl-CoA hydratase/isomerase family protein [Metabacillus lacus]